MSIGRAARHLAPIACGHARALVIATALLALGACSSAPDLIGGATGGTVGALTANPAVGVAVGLGTRAAVDVTLSWAERRRHRTEQDQIAAAAGLLEPGQQASWAAHHTIAVGDSAGLVEVVRLIPSPLAACKEILFWDQPAPPATPRPYTATVCQQGDRWKWASAEPSTRRWGSLQ